MNATAIVVYHSHLRMVCYHRATCECDGHTHHRPSHSHRDGCPTLATPGLPHLRLPAGVQLSTQISCRDDYGRHLAHYAAAALWCGATVSGTVTPAPIAPAHMSQPPDQPPLTTVSSFASNSSTAGTPTSEHHSLNTPPPRTLSNSLTPSLPAGVPSPLTYTPSIGAASPAFSVSDSLYSSHPRSSLFPSLSPTSSLPSHTQPSRSLAESGHHHLTAVLSGVHALLTSYQRLSAVDSAGLQSAASRREESDEEERQIAAAAHRQRQDVEAGLAALQSIVAILVERDTPKLNEPADEERIRQLTARRDHLLQLVSEGNADLQAFIGRLRSLHRSLGLFAHEYDVQLHATPLGVSTQPSSSARR